MDKSPFLRLKVLLHDPEAAEIQENGEDRGVVDEGHCSGQLGGSSRWRPAYDHEGARNGEEASAFEWWWEFRRGFLWKSWSSPGRLWFLQKAWWCSKPWYWSLKWVLVFFSFFYLYIIILYTYFCFLPLLSLAFLCRSSCVKRKKNKKLWYKLCYFSVYVLDFICM